MDEWTEVKAKPKKKKVVEQGPNKPTFGGKGKGGVLIAGPVQNAATMGGGNFDYSSTANQASSLVEYEQYQNEYGEDFEEAKVELVSHVCAQAVSENRLKNKLT